MKPRTELEKAVVAWWRNHRPLAYTAAKHRANPTVNVFGSAEQRLAKLAAKIRSVNE